MGTESFTHTSQVKMAVYIFVFCSALLVLVVKVVWNITSKDSKGFLSKEAPIFSCLNPTFCFLIVQSPPYHSFTLCPRPLISLFYHMKLHPTHNIPTRNLAVSSLLLTSTVNTADPSTPLLFAPQHQNKKIGMHHTIARLKTIISYSELIIQILFLTLYKPSHQKVMILIINLQY